MPTDKDFSSPSISPNAPWDESTVNAAPPEAPQNLGVELKGFFDKMNVPPEQQPAFLANAARQSEDVAAGRLSPKLQDLIADNQQAITGLADKSAEARGRAADATGQPASREAVVGAVLTQMLALAAGAAIGGKRGAIVGLGAGAVGGGQIIEDEAEANKEIAAQSTKQADSVDRQIFELQKQNQNLELQGIKMDDANARFNMSRQDKLNQNAISNDIAFKRLEGEGEQLSKAEERMQSKAIDSTAKQAEKFSEEFNKASSGIGRLRRIKGELQQSNQEDDGVVLSKLEGVLGSVFPNAKIGKIQNYKDAIGVIATEMRGESVSRSSVKDMEAFLAELNAKSGNSVQDFLDGIDKYQRLVTIDYLRRYNDQAEKVNKGLLYPDMVSHTPEEIISRFGWTNVPSLKVGKEDIKLDKLLVPDPRQEGKFVTLVGDQVNKYFAIKKQ